MHDNVFLAQVYSKVSGEPSLQVPTVDVSSKEFYGEGYDDSDKRIPDMAIINKQIGICMSLQFHLEFRFLEACFVLLLITLFMIIPDQVDYRLCLLFFQCVKY